MTKFGIELAPWYEQYSWAHYWANTIMLTVGFGDITASTYREAIFIIAMQTIGIMAFAYTINCVGNIIQGIRARDEERSHKAKIFSKLSAKNKLSEDITWKINNYIEETARLRKVFDYEEEKELVTSLPPEMRK
jgi:voltage-gated potassium channel Kch